MTRRSLLGFIAVAAVLLAAAGVAGAVFIGDGPPDPPPSLRALDLESCRGLDGMRPGLASRSASGACSRA